MDGCPACSGNFWWLESGFSNAHVILVTPQRVQHSSVPAICQPTDISQCISPGLHYTMHQYCPLPCAHHCSCI